MSAQLPGTAALKKNPYPATAKKASTKGIKSNKWGL